MSNFRTALQLAYRHIDAATTSEAEREATLAAIAMHLNGPEAELAAQTLYHLREQRRLQLTLKTVMEIAK